MPGIVAPIVDNAAADYLVHIPQPLGWLLSVLEFSAFDGRFTPNTLGQGEVPQSALSFRMGGYFATYVLCSLGFLVIGVTRLGRRGLLLGLYFAALTIATSILPASHELRYYMYWIMTLVSLVAVLFISPLVERSTPEMTAAWKVIVASTFIAIGFLTGFQYLRPGIEGNSARYLAYYRQEAREKIKPGDVVCVADQRTATLISGAYGGRGDYKVFQSRPDDPHCTVRM